MDHEQCFTVMNSFVNMKEINCMMNLLNCAIFKIKVWLLIVSFFLKKQNNCRKKNVKEPQANV